MRGQRYHRSELPVERIATLHAIGASSANAIFHAHRAELRTAMIGAVLAYLLRGFRLIFYVFGK
jgi:hypothetical protein